MQNTAYKMVVARRVLHGAAGLLMFLILWFTGPQYKTSVAKLVWTISHVNRKTFILQLASDLEFQTFFANRHYECSKFHFFVNFFNFLF